MSQHDKPLPQGTFFATPVNRMNALQRGMHLTWLRVQQEEGNGPDLPPCIEWTDFTESPAEQKTNKAALTITFDFEAEGVTTPRWMYETDDGGGWLFIRKAPTAVDQVLFDPVVDHTIDDLKAAMIAQPWIIDVELHVPGDSLIRDVIPRTTPNASAQTLNLFPENGPHGLPNKNEPC